jgi:uncharacterized membrane protein
MLYGFHWLDVFALSWFLLCWIGYVWAADRPPWNERSVSAAMNDHRRKWMRNMVRRDPRMLDAIVQGNLLHGVSFYASTSILLIGGLLAMLGASEKALAVLQALPLTEASSRTLWEVKVLLLVLIFIYAFFKFAWCYRLFNYCSVMIGGAAIYTEPDPANDRYADHIAQLHGLAASHFNNGLRAYFFALAALSWFLHPLLFLFATTWVTLILYRREFRSRSWRLLHAARQDVS